MPVVRQGQHDQRYHSDTGNGPPSGCSTERLRCADRQDHLDPDLRQCDRQWHNAEYHVYGYAAFKFTGYYFAGTYKGPPTSVQGPDRCIAGYFTRYVDLNEVLEIGTGPQLGLSIVTLIE